MKLIKLMRIFFLLDTRELGRKVLYILFINTPPPPQLVNTLYCTSRFMIIPSDQSQFPY